MIDKNRFRSKHSLFVGEELVENIPKDVSIKIKRKTRFSGRNKIYAVFRRTPDTRRTKPLSTISTGKFTWLHNGEVFAEFKVEKIFRAYVYSYIEPEKLPEGNYVVIFKSDDKKIVEFASFIVMPYAISDQKIEQLILLTLSAKSPMPQRELTDKILGELL